MPWTNEDRIDYGFGLNESQPKLAGSSKLFTDVTWTCQNVPV